MEGPSGVVRAVEEGWVVAVLEEEEMEEEEGEVA